MTDNNTHSIQSSSKDVQAFLEELEQFPWFEHTGKPIQDEGIKQVFSLNTAWECMQDDSYTYASFHLEVDQAHPVWAEAYDRVFDIVSKSGRNYELEKDNPIARSAAWDAGGAAYQIAVGNKTGFYIHLMEWYRKGHWPCGWEGEYPDGKLIVY